MITHKKGIQAAHEIVRWLFTFPYVKEVFLCGGLRRKKPYVKDIDIFFLGDRMPPFKKIFSEILWQGEKKVGGVYKGIRVDIRRIACKRSIGGMLLHLTGSSEFNILCRKTAKKMGLRLNEYGLFRGAERVVDSEEEILKHLGLEKYYRPELRTGEEKASVEKPMFTHVLSSCGDSYYKVVCKEGVWKCECPHWIYRRPKGGCKHIIAAKAPLIKEANNEMEGKNS